MPPSSTALDAGIPPKRSSIVQWAHGILPCLGGGFGRASRGGLPVVGAFALVPGWVPPVVPWNAPVRPSPPGPYPLPVGVLWASRSEGLLHSFWESSLPLALVQGAGAAAALQRLHLPHRHAVFAEEGSPSGPAPLRMGGGWLLDLSQVLPVVRLRRMPVPVQAAWQELPHARYRRMPSAFIVVGRSCRRQGTDACRSHPWLLAGVAGCEASTRAACMNCF